MPKKAAEKSDPPTEEEKAAIEAKKKADAEAEEKLKREAEASEAEKLSKINELKENMISSNGKFDSDYYGFAIDHFITSDLKRFPFPSTTGNIILGARHKDEADDKNTAVLKNPKKDVPMHIIATNTPGPFSGYDYYRTSLEEQIWNTPAGESVTLDDMHNNIRAVIKQKREEGINILFAKLEELDSYGNEKRSSSILKEEYNKRRENKELGNIRLGCQVYDKNRRLFIYLGNLELILCERYKFKVPGKKDTVDISVFYFVA
jgi:hypothetical protein